MKKLLIGGLVGGVIVFIWGMISWMVLPWHNSTLEKFKSEMVVENVMMQNAPQKGVYVLPNGQGGSKEDQKQAYKKMMEGPFIFAVVDPDGVKPMPVCMVLGLLIQLAGGLLVMWLLMQTKISSYVGRIRFVKMAALFAGVVCFLPALNWWAFPLGYTLIGFLDLLIGWGLAGAWMAKVYQPE